MDSIQSPPSLNDINDIFENFINKECLLGETPNILHSRETTFGDNPQQQQQKPNPQGPSPPATPETKCASSINVRPQPYPALGFSESHFHATEMTDLPPWADTFNLFNYELATPHAMPVDDLLATLGESVLQAPVTSMPPNATTGSPPQSPTQYSVLPPTPFSPPSATTSPATIAPPPAPPSVVHSALVSTPAATTHPSTRTRPSPKPRSKITPPCTSPHCHPTTTTQNPETTHHHHHKDSKRRFCCSHKGCASCTSYTTRKDRRRHEESKHSELRLICDLCGHTTAREDNMRYHVRAAHDEECEVVMKRIVGIRVRVVTGL